MDFLDGDTTIRVEDPAKGVWTSRKTDLLCYVTEPEEKRRIIGDTFMEVAKKVRPRTIFQAYVSLFYRIISIVHLVQHKFFKITS